MSKSKEKFIPLSDEFAQFANANQNSMQAALRSYNGWLRSAGKIQAELLQFINKRIEKDLEMPKRFAECGDAADFFEQQMAFTNTMIKDYSDENQRLFKMWSHAARDLEMEAETTMAEHPKQEQA